MPRRDFLHAGLLGIGALILTDWLRGKARAARGEGYVKDKAVALLLLGGWPSQYETFEPKPDGSQGSTSIAGHLATAIPGVRLATYFPRLARPANAPAQAGVALKHEKPLFAWPVC